MYLKCHKRRKDGKLHRYWSIVESYRLANGVSAKRQVLYLGEINDAQKAGWCRIIEAFESGTETPHNKSRCFPVIETLRLNCPGRFNL